ncbi:MAG: YHS domain-containing protein [Candidatus Levybacteria bacterium]|nr:YHS domain-containing protein [Candidatus Levybacteria bacterium]
MFGLFGKVTDPVCKMGINKKEAKFSSESKGNMYYFCSQNCKDKFGTDPKKYAVEETKSEECCH